MVRIPSSEEFAWAAGFLEGEGWFAIRPQNGRMRVGANQVNREPLDRLQSICGGEIYQRTKVTRDGHNRRPWWGWELTDQRAIIDLTEAILPWLSENRKSRIPWVETETMALSGMSAYTAAQRDGHMS